VGEVANKRQNQVIPSQGITWLFFIRFCLFHLIIDGITDETVEAFFLTGCESLDEVSPAPGNDCIDPVISHLVVTGSSFLLCIRILGHNHFHLLLILP
jgi:hypothetical protein